MPYSILNAFKAVGMILGSFKKLSWWYLIISTALLQVTEYC